MSSTPRCLLSKGLLALRLSTRLTTRLSTSRRLCGSLRPGWPDTFQENPGGLSAQGWGGSNNVLFWDRLPVLSGVFSIYCKFDCQCCPTATWGWNICTEILGVSHLIKFKLNSCLSGLAFCWRFVSTCCFDFLFLFQRLVSTNLPIFMNIEFNDIFSPGKSPRHGGENRVCHTALLCSNALQPMTRHAGSLMAISYGS